MSKTNQEESILLRVDKVITDRTEYKPYVVELTSDDANDILVSIPVDKEYVISKGKEYAGQVVLTVDGVAQLVGRVADAIDKMHEAHITKKYKS